MRTNPLVAPLRTLPGVEGENREERVATLDLNFASVNVRLGLVDNPEQPLDEVPVEQMRTSGASSLPRATA